MIRASVVLMVLAALAAPLDGQSAAGRYSPPRLWDGKTPDFRGLWRAEANDLNVERLVVDPADHRIPYRPEARTRRLENEKNRTADPLLKCYQPGVPRATYLSAPLQILQSPGNLSIVYQTNHSFRVFYPESRPHFEAADWWMGDTRYRWDGDTLVADVVALTDALWLDQAGNYHSADVHVVERYTMIGADTIRYEARLEDSTVYTRPWTIRLSLRRLSAPSARIIEDECLEDENGVRHHISPFDPRSLLKSRLKLPASWRSATFW